MEILLIGDSILDNEVYVGKENSVSTVLQRESAKKAMELSVTKWAVDGYTTVDVEDQIRLLPDSQYHTIIMSIGGNDLLMGAEEILQADSPTPGYQLIRGIIEANYRIYQTLKRRSKNMLIFNLYYPFFDAYGRVFTERASYWIKHYNERLLKQYDGGELFDIASIFYEKEDFTNVIEPSAQGTDKLVKEVICRLKGCGKQSAQHNVRGVHGKTTI